MPLKPLTMADLSVGQILAFLEAPFVASLILTGIHSYLGLHVVEPEATGSTSASGTSSFMPPSASS